MRPDAEVGALDDDVVELRVPATVAYVGTLRTLAASLAARCDLTIDEIEDIRLAVDEACALMLPHAVGGDPLQARFVLSVGAIYYEATVASGAGAEPDHDGFSWSILSALAEDLQVRSTDTHLTISFGKRREAPAGAA